MKHLTVLCCLLLSASAGQSDQKTTLEDIERDYLTNQKMTKLTPPSPPKAALPVQSATQYGFVPSKTIADYIQREPKITYVQPQYVPQQQYQQPDYSQYATSQQQTQAISQKYTNSIKHYSAPQYSTAQYSAPQASRAPQKYAPQTSSSAQQTYRYVPQVQTQAQYQDYDNVQYVTDNSISQGGQQYYTPQYVYLQQYSSPSTAVQTVVDPKGGVQYVMYIPAYVPTTVAEQTQNYENVVYTPTTAQESSPSTYQAPTPPQAQAQAPAQYEAPKTQYVSQTPQKEQVQYVQPKSKYTKAEYVIRREPKSLLDSYIPSIVQLQYYNQAQQQNSVQEPARVSQAVRGKNVKSSYRSEPSDSETTLTYRYQPSLYKS